MSQGAKCGGVSLTKEAGPEIQEICDKVKSSVEEKTGKAYDVFQAKQYSSQIVAGVNYFIKVCVGESDHVHLRVFRSLQGEHTLHSVQEQKKEEDPIEYF